MAFDADLDTIHDPGVDGGQPPTAWGDQINDNFVAQAGYTAHTFTWLGTVTNPTYNSATVVSWYREIGNWMDVLINITMAADTDFGSGAWSFRIPNSRSAAGATILGVGWLIDSSTSANNVLIPFRVQSTTITPRSVIDGGISSTVPFTWGTDDMLRIAGRFPLAP